ncbi:CBS domain-containing protein [Streptomyces sp. G45]|uniref:CBS domain-containing protein n=1 Tax=Streptomyces sp. G45 TaxID=3406627 RepID=UPI003C19555D
MTRTVGEVMTRDVVGTSREASLRQVARLLDRHRISGVPVVDRDDKVLGVISETDLIRRQAARTAPGRGRLGRPPGRGRWFPLPRCPGCAARPATRRPPPAPPPPGT